jgi:hypothetical protein
VKKIVEVILIGCGTLFGHTVVVGGIWVILIATTVFLHLVPTPHGELIEECEESLPRNKTCKLVAVEESE